MSSGDNPSLTLNAHSDTNEESAPAAAQECSRLTLLSGPITAGGRKWLLLILALGLLIRLAAAYVQPAFLDEGFVFYTTRAGLDQLVHMLKIDTHPPTFNILMYPLIVSTDSIFLLRLPSVLLSLGTILLSFNLARRFGSERFALVLAACAALSYNLWFADAQLRSYGPLAFCLSAVWVGMLDIRAQGRPFACALKLHPRWQWPLFTLLALGAASLHYLGVLALFCCGLMALALPAQSRRHTIVGLILAVIPIVAWFIWSRATCHYEFPANPSGLRSEDMASLFFSATAIASWIPNLPELLPDEEQAQLWLDIFAYCSYALGAALWASFLWGWYRTAQQERWNANFLGLTLLLPLLILLLASAVGRIQNTQYRYAIPLSLPFLILVGRAWSEKWRYALFAALLAYAALLGLAFPFCPQLWNQNWRGTIAFIDGDHQPNDLIVIYNPFSGYCFSMAYDPQHITYRFDEGYHAQLIQQPAPGKAPIFLLSEDMVNEELARDLRGFRLKLVLCQEFIDPRGPQVVQWFLDRYRVSSEYHEPSLRGGAKINAYTLEPR